MNHRTSSFKETFLKKIPTLPCKNYSNLRLITYGRAKSIETSKYPKYKNFIDHLNNLTEANKKFFGNSYYFPNFYSKNKPNLKNSKQKKKRKKNLVKINLDKIELENKERKKFLFTQTFKKRKRKKFDIFKNVDTTNFPCYDYSNYQVFNTSICNGFKDYSIDDEKTIRRGKRLRNKRRCRSLNETLSDLSRFENKEKFKTSHIMMIKEKWLRNSTMASSGLILPKVRRKTRSKLKSQNKVISLLVGDGQRDLREREENLVNENKIFNNMVLIN